MEAVMPRVAITLYPQDYDAVLFDLDGVLTNTAQIHASAWKKLFDNFLEQHATQNGYLFVPFDRDSDYLLHVDGKPRYDGASAFLSSRGIDLPWGSPEDGPDVQSICALGNLKDRYFLLLLEREGVEAYESSVALVQKLRALNIKTAVTSSSNNCREVLEAAGLSQLFDAHIDGIEITRLNIKGKPAPDGFLEAARLVGAEPARAVVIEDAIAGIEAGRTGLFGCVIGVDRNGHAEALRDAGADIVVSDLAQVRAEEAQSSATWSLGFYGFDPAEEGIREALCSLGNGYVTMRGAAVGSISGGIHYPGTYFAGIYNRLCTDIAGRVIENEDIVNFPNWLMLKFRIDDNEWFDPGNVTLLSYHQKLDLRGGMLLRSICFEDASGRRTTLKERSLVSMSTMHLGALELTLTAENWSAGVTVRSAIDGRIINAGAKLYHKFKNKHLEPVASSSAGEDGVFMLVRTNQSNIHVAEVARTQAFLNGELLNIERCHIKEPEYIAEEFDVELKQGETMILEKVASFYTSRDLAISECGFEAHRSIARAGRFTAVLEEHLLTWKYLWHRFDIAIRTTQTLPLNAPMLLRLNTFHLLQAVSPNSIGLDTGVPARGWTGEAYQGHIFWDELFIFPFFNFRMPEITRSLLIYRYRRLKEARAAAREAGYKGAMFPWQSGSDGQEETQKFNLNPRSQRLVPDNSFLQRHVGSAIVHNVWHYYQVTHDVEFLDSYGAEMILDIAIFWSSITLFNPNRERYEIHGVMGPDEFHDAYPDSAIPGLNNNAYTNIMAVWVFCRALEVLDLLSDVRRAEITTRLALSAEDIVRWDDISRRIYVPLQDNGIISQFEGYEKLQEINLDDYRTRYGNIQRLDLILEQENDSANRYKLSKQPDVLMLFYLFSAEEIGELFKRLGYPFEYETIPRNIAYYVDRSSQGSTLSRVVSAWVLARSDRPRAMHFFAEALQSDVGDIQHGTTAEGVHLGAMAGTIDFVQRVLTGIEVRDNVLRLHPELPREIERLDMRIRYRGHSLYLRLTHDSLTIHGSDSSAPPISLSIDDKICELISNTTCVFQLSKGRYLELETR